MKLFDFLIVPVYRSGGTAIQRFVSLHPNVVAIPKLNLDDALESRQEEQLLAALQPFMRDNPDMKLGLVQHNFIRERKNSNLEEIADRLSRIVRKDGLVLIFGEHVDAMISTINHTNIRDYCHYQFDQAGLPWPDTIVIPGDLRKLLRSYLDRSEEPMDPAGRIRNLNWFVQDSELNRFRYAETQEIYERYFERALVLDYADILSQKNSKSLRKIFQRIGVAGDVYCSFVSTQQWGRSHRFLEHNYVAVTVDDLPEMRVLMRSRTIQDYAIEIGGTAITTVNDDYIREELGFSDGLSLSTVSPFKLHESGRKQEIAIRHHARKFQREFYYPLWRHHYEAVSNVIDQFRIRALPKDIRTHLEQALASDTTNFFADNVEIGQNWKNRAN